MSMMEGFNIFRAIQVVTGLIFIAVLIRGKIVKDSRVARMHRVNRLLMMFAGVYLLVLGIFGEFPKLF